MTLHRRLFLGGALGATFAATLPRALFAAGKPSFPLYDTHAHFFTNDVAHYPYNPGAPAGVRERIVARVTSTPMTPDVVFKVWDENGIAKGCGVQYNSIYTTDNRYLLDITKAHPDRITAIVILNPVESGTPAMLETMARENRIAGVRFTGQPDATGEHHFFTPAAAPSWAMANKLGLVIVLMPVTQQDPRAMARAMVRVAEHAARYPNVRIVLDHIGFPDPKDAPATFGLSEAHIALARHRNVYQKYTTLLIERLHEAKVPAKDFLEHMVKVYGADKMVWGTDVGNTQGSVSDFVKQALDSASGLSMAQQRAIFHDTAERIFIPGGKPA